MTAPRNRRKGFRIERNPGMKLALTGLSLAGFAVGWMGFATGSHPGDKTATSTTAVATTDAAVTQPALPSSGTSTSPPPDQSQPTPSYSVPTYRTSRGS